MNTLRKSQQAILLLVILFLSSQLYSYSFHPVGRGEAVFNSQSVIVEKKSKDEDKKEDTEKKKKKEPIVESEFQPILLGTLLEKPQDFLNKKIKIRGKFSSFTTLALDYEPALRKAKDYISLCIFRTDSKIPLSELKLAYPIEDAKDNVVIRELEEGDLIEMYGQVFSTALDEPWVDILSIKKLESANKKSDDSDKTTAEKENNTNKGKLQKKNKNK